MNILPSMLENLELNRYVSPSIYRLIISKLLDANIQMDRIRLADEDKTLASVIDILSHGNGEELQPFQINLRRSDDTFYAKAGDGSLPQVGIIGAGDFAVAMAASIKHDVSILCYDFEPVRNVFTQLTRISTNRSFANYLGANISFTSEIKKVLQAPFILLSVPAASIPAVIADIKKALPDHYKNKQYIVVSKGFIGRGYIPHRWMQRNGIAFDHMIWASGGNVAKDVVRKQGLKMAVVSINKNKKARHEFAQYLNSEYLVPLEYSGSALLACELGGILKNYYAGLGRYILLRHGEEAFLKYKLRVRREFRKAVRIVSKAPTISIRAWVIRKASHGPAFWEDLDVTAREGRNGRFGELLLGNHHVGEILESVGLVESFQTVFSTLSLFNRLSQRVLKRLPILKAIMEIYEEVHIEYLQLGDAVVSLEQIERIRELESKIINRSFFRNFLGI